MAKRCGPNRTRCGMSQGLYNPFFQNGAQWYGSGGSNDVIDPNPVFPTGLSWSEIIYIDPSVNLWQDQARTTTATTDGSSIGSIQYHTGAYLSTATANERPTLKL